MLSHIRQVLILLLFVQGPFYFEANAAPVPKEADLTIRTGEGVTGCKIGGTLENAEAIFGKSTSASEKYKDDPKTAEHMKDYFHFTEKGIDILLNKGKISAIFFYYDESQSHKIYAGKTDKGIGKESTVENVIKQYGKAESQSERIVSEYGPKPGAKEKCLQYPKQGITFTFYDDKLADIRIYEKDN
jgi:hypothetical protein